jgi:hypothetical protein
MVENILNPIMPEKINTAYVLNSVLNMDENTVAETAIIRRGFSSVQR